MKTITVESKMLCHMAFTTVHKIKYEHTIKGEGLLNDRVFYSEHDTKKRANSFDSWGKTQSLYYFTDTPKGKEFKTMTELLASKNLKISPIKD